MTFFPFSFLFKVGNRIKFTLWIDDWPTASPLRCYNGEKKRGKKTSGEENPEQMVIFTTSFTFAYVRNACEISRNWVLPERKKKERKANYQ